MQMHKVLTAAVAAAFIFLNGTAGAGMPAPTAMPYTVGSGTASNVPRPPAARPVPPPGAAPTGTATTGVQRPPVARPVPPPAPASPATAAPGVQRPPAAKPAPSAQDRAITERQARIQQNNARATGKAIKKGEDKKKKAAAAAAADKTAARQPAGGTALNTAALPPGYKSIGIFGPAVASKGQAVALIKANNPTVHLACSIEELVNFYWVEAGREGVRPDLALAQALVETGFFRYGGDVQHNQNNFCGLGTTGNGVKGAAFPTPEIGVRAHIQHLLAYTQKKQPSTKIVDPRYDLAHKIRLERGMVDTWYGLNGTWAMGSNYCEKIMLIYQRMLVIQPVPLSEQPRQQLSGKKARKAAGAEEKRATNHRMRDRTNEILQEKK